MHNNKRLVNRNTLRETKIIDKPYQIVTMTIKLYLAYNHTLKNQPSQSKYLLFILNPPNTERNEELTGQKSNPITKHVQKKNVE